MIRATIMKRIYCFYKKKLKNKIKQEYLLYDFLKKKKSFKIGHYYSYSVAWTKKLSILNKFYKGNGEKERNEDQYI